MNTVTIKFGQGTEAWKDMQEVVKALHDKGYIAQPYEDIGTVKLTKKINDELVDKKQQFNCDICFLNKDIEEKSIYQFDEGGDIVACVDCEKKHLNSQKPNKIVIWSESRWCSGIYVHIFIRLDYWSSNRIGRKINRKIKGNVDCTN